MRNAAAIRLEQIKFLLVHSLAPNDGALPRLIGYRVFGTKLFEQHPNSGSRLWGYSHIRVADHLENKLRRLIDPNGFVPLDGESLTDMAPTSQATAAAPL